jgi:hypothetical protein
MKSFVFTPLAARDLNEIWDYLASDKIKAVPEGFSGNTGHCLQLGPWEFLGLPGRCGFFATQIQRPITRNRCYNWLNCYF